MTNDHSMTNRIMHFTTPDQAIRALLQVKPSDVAKLEARERTKKPAGK